MRIQCNHLLSRVLMGFVGLSLACSEKPAVPESAGLGQSPNLPQANATQREQLPLSATDLGRFAFSNQQGTQLLVTSDLLQPERFRIALCPSGRFPVEFLRRQGGTDAAGVRQSAFDFEQVRGALYRLTDGSLGESPFGETCFIASDSLDATATVLPVTQPERPRLCEEEHRLQFAAARSRPVIHCWSIGDIASEGLLALVEFAPQETSALASVVLLHGGHVSFADYQAESTGDNQFLWRVDDEGRLFPETFQVPFVLQRADSYLLPVSWSGAEGNYLSLFVSDAGGQSREVLTDYWYRAPR